jgi:hypothetical protein
MILANHGVGDAEAYALARALVGMPTDGVPVHPLIRLLLEQMAWNAETLRERIEAIRQLWGDGFVGRIFAINPNDPPPVPMVEKNKKHVHVPALPAVCNISDEDLAKAEKCGLWMKWFMDWATQRASMTSPIFLQSGGLWALGLTIARRISLRLDFADIYPNLYVLWVAPTTYFKKSTGLRAVEQLARTVAPHLLLAAQVTPEMILSQMSGRMVSNYDDLSPYQKGIEERGMQFAAQRGIVVDEASTLFSQKDYMKGFAEVVMNFYDNPEMYERAVMGMGKLVVQQAYLSILGATTPARLARLIDGSEWEDGLFARFALCTPEDEVIHWQPSGRQNVHFDPPTSVLAILKDLNDRLPNPRPVEALDDGITPPGGLRPMSARAEPEVIRRFNAYAETMHQFTAPDSGLDERLRGNYGRFAVMVLKVATQIAATDWIINNDGDSPKVKLEHWVMGQQIVERWRESAHRLIAELGRNRDMRNEDRILDFLRSASGLKTERDIYRGTGMARQDAKAAINALLADHVVVGEMGDYNKVWYRLA